MPGGLLNLIAVGNQNVILNGNPTKTFFKATYSKYTNFGLQKFRIDFIGLRNLKLREESNFSFKIPRYGDILLDTYVALTLPDIWSPVFYNLVSDETDTGTWAPYEFKWIKNLGTQMIKEVSITCGNATLQRYSGDALTVLLKRDLSETQKKKLDIMTGNTIELNDPANAFGRENQYPNAVYDINYSPVNSEPSIRGRNIYIPLKNWFSQTSKQGLPLVALQYNELFIHITFRPVCELCKVKTVDDSAANISDYQKLPDGDTYGLYRFLNSPPEHGDAPTYTLSYPDKRNDWNSDVHLISTYGFLSDQENRQFAKSTHDYLIKDICEYEFNDIYASSKIKVPTTGLVSTWTIFLRRNDVYKTNEWSNYTNWENETIPSDIISLTDKLRSTGGNSFNFSKVNIHETGEYSYKNDKNILISLGILCDGKYKENVFNADMYQMIENYIKSKGYCEEGIYTYNFCLDNSPENLQPSGAMNLSKFKTIELEISTLEPPDNPNFSFDIQCGDDGPVSYTKTASDMYEYTYDLHIIEERYNVLTFMSGNCGLKFSR
tara:strand:- start:3730 stop:5376 length:1647 start_codon:yes stop_codon:yes gene_type:complete